MTTTAADLMKAVNNTNTAEFFNNYQPKNVICGEVARAALKAGVRIQYNSVGSTLGCKGHNVVMRTNNTTLVVTKDGVSVASTMKVDNPYVAVGVDLVRDASRHSLAGAGDGTTTAMVLTGALVEELDALPNLHGFTIKRQIDKLLVEVLEQLEKNTIECSGLERLTHVATVSANNMSDIGKIVAEAVHTAGDYGNVLIQKGDEVNDNLEVVVGSLWKNGYTFATSVNDFGRDCFVSDDCDLLLADGDKNHQGLYNVVAQTMTTNNRNLLLVVRDMDEELTAQLSGINVQFQRAGINKRVCVVKAALYGNNRSKAINDLALMTGADVIMLGQEDLTNVKVGRLTNVEVTTESTSFTPMEPQQEALDRHLAELKTLSTTLRNIELEWLKERIAILSGKICIIKVGGVSEVEAKERTDLYDDAVCAARAALKDGILAGGGNELRAIGWTLQQSDDEVTAAFGRAIMRPSQLILENCGFSHEEALQSTYGLEACGTHGYNGITNEEVNLIEAGIIDPALVTKTALRSAVGVVGTIITTNHLILQPESVK